MEPELRYSSASCYLRTKACLFAPTCLSQAPWAPSPWSVEVSADDLRYCSQCPAAMRCLSFLLVTAAPLHALAQDERPVPPLPIGPRQSNHARALSEMADTTARDSAKCQSSGAALGSQAYKKCRLLEDKIRIENDVPSDRGYASTRGR